MEPILQVSDLSVSYGSINAVKNVSFQVNPGEVVTLIGANGAGKSTILNTISGLLHPKSGSILFQGKDLHGIPADKILCLGLAQVPEGRHVFLQMTVEENLEMGAYTQPKSTIAPGIADVYQRFPRLKERRRQIAGTLSGGEQQMLAMGRALMSKPTLLMLDEPSMGLAPILVEQIFGIIRELHAAGTTILLVEQNAQAALSVADRAYVLETGSIALSGTGAASAPPAPGRGEGSADGADELARRRRYLLQPGSRHPHLGKLGRIQGPQGQLPFPPLGTQAVEHTHPQSAFHHGQQRLSLDGGIPHIQLHPRLLQRGHHVKIVPSAGHDKGQALQRLEGDGLERRQGMVRGQGRQHLVPVEGDPRPRKPLLPGKDAEIQPGAAHPVLQLLVGPRHELEPHPGIVPVKIPQHPGQPLGGHAGIDPQRHPARHQPLAVHDLLPQPVVGPHQTPQGGEQHLPRRAKGNAGASPPQKHHPQFVLHRRRHVADAGGGVPHLGRRRGKAPQLDGPHQRPAFQKIHPSASLRFSKLTVYQVKQVKPPFLCKFIVQHR